MYKVLSWVPGKHEKHAKILSLRNSQSSGERDHMTTIQYRALTHLPHGAF